MREGKRTEREVYVVRNFPSRNNGKGITPNRNGTGVILNENHVLSIRKGQEKITTFTTGYTKRLLAQPEFLARR
jgi:hypothetical protein